MPCELCQRVAELERRADTTGTLTLGVAVIVTILIIALARSGALPKALLLGTG